MRCPAEREKRNTPLAVPRLVPSTESNHPFLPKADKTRTNRIDRPDPLTQPTSGDNSGQPDNILPLPTSTPEWKIRLKERAGRVNKLVRPDIGSQS